jgi:hypothetical protein
MVQVYMQLDHTISKKKQQNFILIKFIYINIQDEIYLINLNMLVKYNQMLMMLYHVRLKTWQ